MAPVVIFQDGNFMVKTLICVRHNHNLPTYVYFYDLVKEFDKVNYMILVAKLKVCISPPNFLSSIAIV